MLLPAGAHGSTTPDFEPGCCQDSLVSGALLNHGSGCSGFGFESHGSFNGAAFDAKLPFAALFCSQASFDDPDATDGE